MPTEQEAWDIFKSSWTDESSVAAVQGAAVALVLNRRQGQARALAAQQIRIDPQGQANITNFHPDGQQRIATIFLRLDEALARWGSAEIHVSTANGHAADMMQFAQDAWQKIGDGNWAGAITASNNCLNSANMAGQSVAAANSELDVMQVLTEEARLLLDSALTPPPP